MPVLDAAPVLPGRFPRPSAMKGGKSHRVCRPSVPANTYTLSHPSCINFSERSMAIPHVVPSELSNGHPHPQCLQSVQRSGPGSHAGIGCALGDAKCRGCGFLYAGEALRGIRGGSAVIGWRGQPVAFCRFDPHLRWERIRPRTWVKALRMQARRESLRSRLLD